MELKDLCPEKEITMPRGGNRSKPLAQRLWAKVSMPNPLACWEWRGKRSPDGYGKLRDHYREVYAHRVAYEQAFGPIPKGFDVCHRCDNPGCVNPFHLFAGTRSDNMQDCKKKGRVRWGSVLNEAHPNCKVSNADVEKIRTARSAGETLAAIAARYGLGTSQVHRITRGVSRPCPH